MLGRHRNWICYENFEKYLIYLFPDIFLNAMTSDDQASSEKYLPVYCNPPKFFEKVVRFW